MFPAHTDKSTWTTITGITVLAITIAGVYFLARPYQTHKARNILDRTGVEGGLVVHVNCGNGKLTTALHGSDRFLVQGISRSGTSVKEARDYIRKKGLYGKVSAAVWQGKKLPYSNNMVNMLVVSEGEKPAPDEIMRVLSPLGVALIRQEGHWSRIEKPWPPQIDEWSHHMHAPDGNIVAEDSMVGPPAHIQWQAGPDWGRDHRHGNKTAMVSSRGRLFYVDNEIPQASVETLPDRPFLVARNAFSGVLLWKKPIYPRTPSDVIRIDPDPSIFELFEPVFPMELKLVAAGDLLYAAFGEQGEIQVMEASTGEIVRTFDGTGNTEEIMHDGGILLTVAHGSGYEHEVVNHTKKELAYGTYKVERGIFIRARDPLSGALLWEYNTEPEGGLKVSPVIEDNCVYAIVGKNLVKLELGDGSPVWKTELPDDLKNKGITSGIMTWGSTIRDRLIAADKFILLVTMESSDDVMITSFSGSTGRSVWSRQCKTPNYSGSTPAYVIGEKVWVHERYPEEEIDVPHRPTNQLFPVTALDINTGEEIIRYDAAKIFDVDHHHRCYGNRATSRYLLTGRRGVEFTDFGSGEIRLNHWVRGKCRFGVLPCNGLLYSMPHACSCYPYSMITGYTALASGENVTDGEFSGQEGRLEKGPYYQEILEKAGSAKSETGSWPTFRYNGQRSSSTPENVDPGNIKRVSWSTSLEAVPGAMTSAGGRLYVPTPKTHQVHALDMENGKLLWSFTSGSRVDSPPTIYNERVLFGSRDGYVYCLRAEDGGLIWRFRAAPADRNLIDDNQLESIWPVHGAVLVKDDRLYAVAGRTSLLDGGLAMYVLDPESGNVLAWNRLNETYSGTEHRMIGNRGHSYTENDLAVWNDILECDDSGIYLRQLHLDENLVPSDGSGRQLISLSGILNPSWFSRIGAFFGEPTKISRGHKNQNIYDFQDSPRQGTYLIFDELQTYSVRVHPNMGKFSVSFTPGQQGYRICADENGTYRNRWNILAPIRVQAMVACAGKTLYMAGPPDVVDHSDPWGAAEGRKGGLLWAVSTEDGKKLGEYKLDAPPVSDGLIALNGNLYIAASDGKVLCLGSGRPAIKNGKGQ